MTARSIFLSPRLDELGRARDFVREAARAAGFDEDRVFDITVCSSEAASNAIEHATLAGRVEVRTLLSVDRLDVHVEGPGEFEPPRRPGAGHHRGLGLPLMATLADHLALYSGQGGGTRVSLTFYRAERPIAEAEDSILPPSIRELVEQNELVSAVTANAPLGLCVLDAELRYRWANEAYHDLIGVGEDSTSLVGRYLEQTIPGNHGPDLVAMLRSVSETGEPVFWPEYAMEDPGRGETWWRWNAVALARQRGGPPFDVLLVVADVTEQVALRKEGEALLGEQKALSEELAINYEEMATANEELAAQTEELRSRSEELAAVEARFRALVSATSAVIFRVSPDWGEILQLSSPAFLAVTAETGRDWLQDYLPPDERARFRLAIEKAIKERSAFELEHRIFTAHGGVGWALTRAVPLTDARGEILEWFGAASDITQRRIQEANQAFLAELSDDFARFSYTPPELMFSVGSKLVSYLGATGCAIIELDETRDWITVQYEWGTPGSAMWAATNHRLSQVMPLWIREAFSRRETLVVDDTWSDPRFIGGIWPGAGARGFVAEPFHQASQLKYLLTVFDSSSRRWTEEEVGLIREVAALAFPRLERAIAQDILAESEESYRSLAEENERLYREQVGITETLQGALLHVPDEVPGIRLGHVYRSASEAARVGGDFYDVFAANDDKLGIVIGDVSGHGIEAARLAGLTKDLILAFTHETAFPESVLSRTHEFLRRQNVEGFVTVFLGILDLNSGSLLYASAGHPEAILRRHSGQVELLEGGYPPLGVFVESKWPSRKVLLQRGDLLLLYTDGVTEARRGSEFFSEKRLRSIAKERVSSPDRLPQLVLDEVLAFTRGRLRDDLAILALSLDGSVPPASGPHATRANQSKPKNGGRRTTTAPAQRAKTGK